MASRGAGGRVLACGHERDTSPHLGHTTSLPDVFTTTFLSMITSSKQRTEANINAHCITNTSLKLTSSHPQPSDAFFDRQCFFVVASSKQALKIMP